MGITTLTSCGRVRVDGPVKASLCRKNVAPTGRPDHRLRKRWPGRVSVPLTFSGTHLGITVNFLIGLFFPFLFFLLCSLLFKCLAGYTNTAPTSQEAPRRPKKPLTSELIYLRWRPPRPETGTVGSPVYAADSANSNRGGSGWARLNPALSGQGLCPYPSCQRNSE